MTPPVQLVVFDLMGTLVSDGGLVERAYENALVEAGMGRGTSEFESAQLRVAELMGRPTLVVLTEVIGDPVAAEESTWVFDDTILDELPSLNPVPDAAEIVVELNARDIHVAVTTSFSPEVRKAVLRHLGWEELFAAQLSAHGARRGHPSPDLLLEAILELGVDSVAQVAIVGDTVADLEAGNRAGAGLVIGVLTGTHDRATLSIAPHTHIVESVTDVPAVLDAPRTTGARRTADRGARR